MTDFRFGVNMLVSSNRDEWIAKCRRAEELGFDVVAVPDHLGSGMPAPFPALMLAAQATERVRLGTFVLNTPFYNPMLLARDVVGVDVFTGGRLELGLGAGYVEDEFVKAGIPFERPGKRIDHVERTLDVLASFCADPSEPNPVQQPGPKLLIAGGGKRLLKLAAQRADIIAFTGGARYVDGKPVAGTADELDTRMAEVRADLGDRIDDVDLNVIVFKTLVTEDRDAALKEIAPELPGGDALSVAEAGELPSMLVGTVEQIAEQITAHHKRFGFNYFTTLEDGMEDLAKAMKLARG